MLSCVSVATRDEHSRETDIRDIRVFVDQSGSIFVAVLCQLVQLSQLFDGHHGGHEVVLQLVSNEVEMYGSCNQVGDSASDCKQRQVATFKRD